MSNVAGKAYGMNVVTPIRPRWTWLNRFIFMVSRVFPGSLSGLLGLSLIHFARWVIIRRDQWPQRGQPKQVLANDYMLFCSNFNGTWDQYIDAFADGIPNGLDLFWYCSTKYPNSIPITPFKSYIRANQVDTGYYYNATPGSGQRDIKRALQLAAALRAVTAGTDEASAAAFDRVLAENQGCLGTPGYGPVASRDTAIADLHRCAMVRARWGRDGEGPPRAQVVAPAAAAASIQAAPRADASAAQADAAAQAGEVRATVAALVKGRTRRSAARRHG
ncbi:hypothetical protein LRS73_24370 [Methylobacterium currus]|uniref:hypothetical protein n=1 Tax=Methylobacterium currus TaxID=2051553 RepID=UPI001E3CE5A8|nr:hypothetical protein [Methylobacterium currus]UHC15605.1 hypothetical protein LRS73_24370 [Methylobacterium currus]